MMCSIDGEKKILTKLNTHSLMKALNKLGIKENFLKLIKGIYTKAYNICQMLAVKPKAQYLYIEDNNW